MRQKIQLLTILLIISSWHLKSQLTKNSNLIFGSEIRSTISIPANKEEYFPYITVFTFVPHIDFKLKKNLYLGLNYQQTFGQVDYIKITPISAWGLQAKLFHGPIFKDLLFQNHILFNTELNWKKANYYLDGTKQYGYEKLNSYQNNLVDLSFNLDFRVYKSLYVTYGQRFIYYTYNSTYKRGPRVGIQYHFSEKRNIIPASTTHNSETPKIIKPFNYFNPYFFKRFTTSLGFSYLYDYFGPSNTYFQLSSINFNTTVSILKGIDIGFSAMQFNQRLFGSLSSETFNLYGGIVQFEIINQEKSSSKFFLETGFHKRDLCTCGEAAAYKKDNLSYFTLGGGFEQNLVKNKLYLRLFAQKNIITNDKNETGSYLHPQIGLKYKIEK